MCIVLIDRIVFSLLSGHLVFHLSSMHALLNFTTLKNCISPTQPHHLNISLFLDLFRVSVIASHHPHLINFSNLSPHPHSLDDCLTLSCLWCLLIPRRTIPFFIQAVYSFPRFWPSILDHVPDTFRVELGLLKGAGMHSFLIIALKCFSQNECTNNRCNWVFSRHQYQESYLTEPTFAHRGGSVMKIAPVNEFTI